MSSEIEIVGDFSIIGAGSFGILLRANTEAGYPVAIKLIMKFDTEDSGKEFTEMERELAFSYFMGDAGIGPKVLDSFYYNFDIEDIKNYPVLNKVVKFIKDNIKHNRLKGIDSTDSPTEIQLIVMKSYEYDCRQIFDREDLDLSSQVILQMIELMKKQINLGIYCYDVKPSNFVGNILYYDGVGEVDVKMIDFGADFCTEKRIFTGHNNDDICEELGMPYTDVLLISNIIQIYIMYSVFADYKIDKVIVKSFFSDTIFRKFFESDWRLFITNYINDAKRKEMIGKKDPSNQLVHYCNIESYHGEMKYQYVIELLIDLLEYAERKLNL